KFPKQSRRKRTPISPSQTRILVEAFEKNRFPGMAARELLARQTGIPESRIQIWFQNRRARHSAQQSSSGPDTPRKPDSLLLCLWLQHVVTRVYNSAFNAVDHDPGDQPRYQTPHRNAEGQFPTLQQVVQEPPWNPGHSPYMDWIGTSSGPVPGGSRRRRIVLKPSQRDALKAVFRQNPYPGITTRERLAQQLDVPESRIQVWFQNQRTRQRRQSQLGPMSPLGEQQLNWQEQQTHAWTQESFQKQSRRKRTPISPSQTRILVEAFEKNRFPGMAARELLARQTGIPESRIQIWFQNRRARHSAQQSSSGPDTPRKPDSLLLCLWLQHVVTRVYNSAFNAVDHDPGINQDIKLLIGMLRVNSRPYSKEPPWNPGHSPYMDWIGTSSGPVPGGSRRRRIVLKPSQRDALKAVFRQNPYPGITTRERLAQQLDVPESRIQVWFQNQRTRQRRQSQLGPMSPLGEQQLNWQEQQTHAWTQESFQKQSRRKRTPISPSQTRILVEAFEKNRFPGMAARELLARQTGIPESRIQIWFQNRRARHSAQQSSKPVAGLSERER
ncbi:Double homeobox protein 5, partial [Manis javanica]